MRGGYGRIATAIRDDEEAVLALGRNTCRIKVLLLAVGPGIAGVAGGRLAADDAALPATLAGMPAPLASQCW